MCIEGKLRAIIALQNSNRSKNKVIRQTRRVFIYNMLQQIYSQNTDLNLIFFKHYLRLGSNQ